MDLTHFPTARKHHPVERLPTHVIVVNDVFFFIQIRLHLQASCCHNTLDFVFLTFGMSSPVQTHKHVMQ